jgi:hypothetical protein
MVVFSVVFAWLGKHVIRSRNQRLVVARIEAVGGSAYYDYQMAVDYVDPTRSPPGSPIVRSVLGDDIYGTVNAVALYDRKTSDDDIADLHKLPDLLDVYLNGAGVTDQCIDDLLRISRLRTLSLYDTSVSADGLAHLSASRTLQHLMLRGPAISDAHLQQLERFPNLQFLQIHRALVTDDGIKPLGSIRLRKLDISDTRLGNASLEFAAKMPLLERLDIRQTLVTDDGIRHLRHLTSLTRLDLEINNHISTAGVGRLKRHLSKCAIKCWDYRPDGSAALVETR